jgi:hypothetical protein
VREGTIRVRDRIHVGDLFVERRSEGAQLAVGKTAESDRRRVFRKEARDERENKNNDELERKVFLNLKTTNKMSAKIHTHTLTHAHT